MKFILFFLILAFSSIELSGQQPQFNVTQYRAAFAKEKLVVSNTVKTLTSSVYAPTITDASGARSRADYALITVESDCLRYWPTGDDPTTTDGHKVCDGGSFFIYGFDNISHLEMIRITTDVTIQVSYYRFMSNTP